MLFRRSGSRSALRLAALGSLLVLTGAFGSQVNAQVLMQPNVSVAQARKIIDTIIAEPLGGAHRDAGAAIQSLGNAIEASLAELDDKDADTLRRDRREKFLAMGRR